MGTQTKFVSLTVPVTSDSEAFSLTTNLRSSRSIWRWWKQLSRLQRSLVYMGVTVLCLLVIYCFPASWSQGGQGFYQKLDLSYQRFAPPFGRWREDRQVQRSFRPQYSKQPAVNIPSPPSWFREPRDMSEAPSVQNAAPFQAVDGETYRPPPLWMGLEGRSTQNHPQVSSQKQVPKFSGPTNDRQRAVVNAFMHAWKGYRKFAWGQDHLKPISGASHNWFGLGLTLIDSLDTMLIMGLTEEFDVARNWVANHLEFNVNRDVNLFETTIRILGGLLSAYHLSGDGVFLDKARDLGERLLPCFSTPFGVPYSDVNLATRKAHSPKWSPDSSTSEVTTLQLEFRDLSRSTGDPKFETAAARVSEHVHHLPKKEGLVPIFINAQSGQFRDHSTITFGARGDSYYEYLLKQWIQTGRNMDYLRDDYNRSMTGMMKFLARRTSRNGLLFVGELLGGGKEFKPKMDHLVCYLPGTMAVGVHHGMPREHFRFAEELLYTCYQMYARQPTFLAPEITYFNIQRGASSDLFVKANDAHSLLRPETIESLWYFYHLTGNTTYQDWGWQIFQAIEKYAKVRYGYTSLGSVKNTFEVKPRDLMESFFLAETLKYLYLLFSEEQQVLNVEDFVFNSEAHPLPVYERR